MVDLIGDIVDFFIKSVVFKIIGYFFILGFIFAAFIEAAYFKATGHIDLTIFFNSNILGELALYYRKEIAITGIAVTLFYMFLALYLQNKISKRANCAVQEVELKKIAQLWLEGEAYKEVIRQEVMDEINISSTDTQENKGDFIIPDFKYERSRELLRFINENKASFTFEGVKIITELLKILENNPTSSVASKFKSDPNYKDYKKLVTGNKTSYDILSEVDLYTHTLNVVSEIIKYVKENFGNEKIIYLQRTIIAALAHDIGKIQTPLTPAINEELLKKSPHNIISALILREKYPDTLDTDTIEAVEQHHGIVKNKNNYILKALKEADKKAREKEIYEWLVDHKLIDEENDNKKELSDEENEINKDENNLQDIEENKAETEKENDIQDKVTEENLENNENDEDEDLTDKYDYEKLYDENDEEETDYEDKKEIIKEKLNEPCRIKKIPSGLDLKELLFVKDKKVYISYVYLLELFGDDTNNFKDELIKRKEGYLKAFRIRALGGEYTIMFAVIKDEALDIDLESVNCDEVEIEEGE